MRRPPHDNAPGTRARVLVVDDNDALCELLRDFLSEEGYAVAIAPHGAAALELVKLHQPAVIILDLLMPTMDGWSFADQYRRLGGPPAALIILLSALTDQDVEESAHRVGAAAFVRKPFELVELLRVIEGRLVAA